MAKFPKGAKSKLDRFDQEIIDVMQQSGVAPQLIYAYMKTGLILMEDNRGLYRAEAEREYQAAIDEFFEFYESDDDDE